LNVITDLERHHGTADGVLIDAKRSNVEPQPQALAVWPRSVALACAEGSIACDRTKGALPSAGRVLAAHV